MMMKPPCAVRHRGGSLLRIAFIVAFSCLAFAQGAQVEYGSDVEFLPTMKPYTAAYEYVYTETELRTTTQTCLTLPSESQHYRLGIKTLDHGRYEILELEGNVGFAWSSPDAIGIYYCIAGGKSICFDEFVDGATVYAWAEPMAAAKCKADFILGNNKNNNKNSVETAETDDGAMEGVDDEDVETDIAVGWSSLAGIDTPADPIDYDPSVGNVLPDEAAGNAYGAAADEGVQMFHDGDKDDAARSGAVMWSTPKYILKADSFSYHIEGDREELVTWDPSTYTTLEVDGDPGNDSYMSIEISWTPRHETLERRMFMYFNGDYDNTIWTVNELRLTNDNHNWETFSGHGILLANMGSCFRRDQFSFTNDRGSTIRFDGLAIAAFLPWDNGDAGGKDVNKCIMGCHSTKMMTMNNGESNMASMHGSTNEETTAESVPMEASASSVSGHMQHHHAAAHEAAGAEAAANTEMEDMESTHCLLALMGAFLAGSTVTALVMHMLYRRLHNANRVLIDPHHREEEFAMMKVVDLAEYREVSKDDVKNAAADDRSDTTEEESLE